MKKLYESLVRLLPTAFLITPISADMTPQPLVKLSQGLEGTFAADWEGIAGRIYFMQWSTDLIAWRYSPFLDFGDGMHSYGFQSSTDKFFVRLECIDDPEITTLDEAMEADFDGDGLSNIFEVTYGYNPTNEATTEDGPDSSLDPESDGLTNATESLQSLNPMVKDNPKLLLGVSAE